MHTTHMRVASSIAMLAALAVVISAFQNVRALSPMQSPLPEPPAAPPAQTVPVEQPAAVPTSIPTIAPADVMSGAVKLFDFERRMNWRSRPSGSTLTRSTEQKHAGAASGKMSYVLPATANNFVIFELRTRLIGRPTGLSAWVFGDGSGHYLNTWLQDGTGQVRQFTFGRVTHTGWKQMLAELATDVRPWPANSHVSGRDTGKLMPPYTFGAMVLDGVPDGKASHGTIYMDEVYALYQPIAAQAP